MGHIGIVEKALESGSDTGMHNNVHFTITNCECVMECGGDTGKNLILVSFPTLPLHKLAFLQINS